MVMPFLMFIKNYLFFRCINGGSGEIRTHGRVSPSLVFKTSALNRSATLPHNDRQDNTFLGLTLLASLSKKIRIISQSKVLVKNMA